MAPVDTEPAECYRSQHQHRTRCFAQPDSVNMHELKLCPFCGNTPYFSGDTAQWQDESRYVKLSIECCVTMTEVIGWFRARDMTVNQRTEELQTRLSERWNNRYTGETS